MGAPPSVRAAALTIAALAMLAAACGSPPVLDTSILDELPVPVAAQASRSGNIRAVLQASGIVVGQEGAEFRVVPPEPARVVDVTRRVGESVGSGDLLVRFELSGASLNLARLANERAAAQADVDRTRSAHERTRDLVERGFLPRLDLDVAERAMADAELALQRVTGAYVAAEAVASRAMVFAPFDGLVAERLLNPGDVAQPLPDLPVLRVVDPERLEVRARIPPRDAPRVLPGAGVRVTSPVQQASVRLVVADQPPMALLDMAGLVPVRLAFVEPVALGVDTRLDLEIDAEERVDVILVPIEALLQEEDEGEIFVFVVNEEDRVERRVVTLGVSNLRDAEITSGLGEGELVVIRGQDVMKEGLLVTAEIEEPDDSTPE